MESKNSAMDFNFYEDNLYKILEKKSSLSVNEIFSLLKLDEIEDREKQEQYAERIKNVLMNDSLLFYDSENDFVEKRDAFFVDGEFLISPDSFELDNKLLFPGHRFMPFCESDIFPAEIVLKYKDKKLSLKEGEFSVVNVVPAHMLMGAEQMFDYFIAENPLNMQLAESGLKAKNKVHLNYFDLSEVFEDDIFSKIEYFKVKIIDWQNGSFELQLFNKNEKDPIAYDNWREQFGTALEKVCRTEANYFEVPEQIALGFYRGGRELLKNPAESYEHFIATTDIVQISYSEGETVLVSGAEIEENMTAEDLDNQLPDGVAVSKGATGDFGELLQEINCPMQQDEIEAYIRNFLYEENNNFEAFYNYCFGNFRLNFADEAQKAVFMNFIEDMWEVISSDYSRVIDKEKAPVRSAVLEIVDKRVEWLRNLEVMDIDEKKLPNDLMEDLAANAVHLSSIIQLLNSEKYILDESEVEDVIETVDVLGKKQQLLINKINALMN